MIKLRLLLFVITLLMFSQITVAQSIDDHLGLAEKLKNEGKFELAIEEYRIVLSLKKENDIEIMSTIATLCKWTRNYKQAESWLEKIIEIDPQNRAALQELEDLRLKRGIHLMAGYGGWEVDYTKKAYDVQIFLGNIDWAEIYFGYSSYERAFYDRKKTFGKVYFFPKHTTYLKFEFNYKDYGYPKEINPNPDDNSYDKVPSYEIELNHNLTPDFRFSLYYEYFNPNFFWGASTRAKNYKIGGELNLRLLDLFNAKLYLARLKDPDPATFKVDKNSQQILNLDYKTEFLLGGGVEIYKGPLEAGLKYIPNRDLDNSLDYSYFINFVYKIRNKNIPFPLEARFDYIYDKYSQWSYLSGLTSKVAMFAIHAEPLKLLALRLGIKLLNKAEENDFGIFIRLIFKSRA